MSPPPLTLIVVGAGRFGINHVTTAHSLNVLAAVVDDNPIALARAKEKLPLASCVQFFSSLSAALFAHPHAAVVVATPPATHYAVAVEAIAARRHVLVEKPLCDTLQRADALVDLASKAGVCLMVDHLLRYSAAHRRLLRLVKAGFVGDVTRVRMTRVNFGTVRTAENVLWSFTPHDVSMLLAICGDAVPVSVACVGQKVVSCGVDDYVDMSLKFEDGVQAQIEASWMHPLKERRLVVYGSRGALILNEAMPGEKPQSLRGFKWSAKRKSDGSAVAIEKEEQDLVTKLNEAGEGSDGDADGKPPLQAAVEHFLDCVRNEEAPLTDGKEGVRVLRVLSAASLSLKKEGMPLSVCEGALSPHVFVHESAAVDQGSVLGAGTKVWHHTHIMSGARLGASCNIGQNVYIGGKAVLGRNVKVQNNVSIYDDVTIDDDVFLGPSCVFTNVKTPRAHINRKNAYTPTTVAKGATVGANATIVCGVRLGAYCFVGAGAVVTKDVPPHALVYGNPAAHRGWVSTTGAKLTEVADMGSDRKILQCAESKEIYTLRNGDSANKEGAYVLLNTDKTI